MIKHTIGKNTLKKTHTHTLLWGFWISWVFLNFLMTFFRGPRCVPAIFLEPLHLPNTAPPHVTSPKSGGVHIIMWVPHSWTLYNGKYWNSIFSFGWFGLIWRVSGIHILDHFSLIWRGFPPAMRLLWPRRFHGCHSGLPVRWFWMNGDTVGPLLNRNIKSP